ncbi:sugar phosphate isomerase/epimerase [Parabacteroides sp. PF5-5]|uniref:sugar phosphate isomerase/epimerase family protein n=1 Tax=unclassified Parabacteroides TaxID=2649774 RepID=UPI00247302DB|nr:MULTISPECIES: sugar phosphate isomerase/epimerase [unclassified Parabacteroides]MDH6303952.1 sugar phosphate isomerase/epimerase [Parabacteroides sp. PH5-39]MDH6314568.1 sugar phosphate isomerase/epimerase [Parabacteroides sp. PF5-13]MDH6318367.1 sugar phosphate isomerase/epimerase [Parabacteroides sp. PH5-13]MDH6322341.1 sugar phosphate isomerase/epimerase [Parabacteroides sp. PH5-8]MDH6325580.1 sugar phosphate isomerase/epimerase [Parabacteroides sp. PH5-41]
MNNQIWLMTSAFKPYSLDQIMEKAKETGVQGLEVCVFPRGGSWSDHVATHIDYESFDAEQARRLLESFNNAGLRFSIGSYENLIGGDPAERLVNQNHLLKLIRIAHLCGGDAQDIKVGTFVGYNDELGVQDGGFEKNLYEYQRVFSPIIKYAEDLGVTIIYENCPMEGWRSKTWPYTYNNLTGTLAARKLMYTLIPSRSHGETYDPSHDIWQHINPADVIKETDMSRLHRVHVKATRNLRNKSSIYWGAMYPKQYVNPELAGRAGVPIVEHDWDRHPFEAMLPGFGGYDSMDWRDFLETLMHAGYDKPFVIENEAVLSSHTGNIGATMQGFKAATLCLAPIVWPLKENEGYTYHDERPNYPTDPIKDIPVVSMKELM